MIDEKNNYLKTDLLHGFHDLRRYFKLTKEYNEQYNSCTR